MIMRRISMNRLAAAALASVLAAGACADADEAHVRAMEQEHAADLGEPSPMAGEAPARQADSSEVHYASLADGVEVHGYLARPESEEPRAGVLLIHEWWGLNDNIRAMADRFAGEGYAALAVDLYEGEVAKTRKSAAELMRGTLDRSARLEGNLRQGREYLVEQVGVTKVGSVGWCFGGGWSLKAALAMGDQLDAAVIYYGRLITEPAELEPLRAPVLGLFGALDQGIPTASVEAFEAALEDLGKTAEIHVYDDADHAFANPTGGRYNEAAAADAWDKTLAFFERFLQ